MYGTTPVILFTSAHTAFAAHWAWFQCAWMCLCVFMGMCMRGTDECPGLDWEHNSARQSNIISVQSSHIHNKAHILKYFFLFTVNARNIFYFLFFWCKIILEKNPLWLFRGFIEHSLVFIFSIIPVHPKSPAFIGSTIKCWFVKIFKTQNEIWKVLLSYSNVLATH